MIALLDNGQDLQQCEIELGCEVGQLLTPRTSYRLRDPRRRWAVDNGAFAGFNPDAFLSLLKRNEEHDRDFCLFVVMPDVVGSARRTLELFDHWRSKLNGWGYPIALACQDGQENLPIPWDAIDAVFIGGSTKWKCSEHPLHIIQTAKALGKWVHVGRVNDPGRWKHFENVEVDSVDGTGIARYTHMREAIADRHEQGTLCLSS